MNAIPRTLEGLARQWIEEPNSGCWIWIGNRHEKGYGAIQATTKIRKLIPAHRLIYELSRGPIPAGLQIDHICRVRSCVNPAHLEPVTQAINIRRGMAPTIIAWRTDNCLRGHSLADAYQIKTGRQCRVCITQRNRARSVASRTV